MIESILLGCRGLSKIIQRTQIKCLFKLGKSKLSKVRQFPGTWCFYSPRKKDMGKIMSKAQNSLIGKTETVGGTEEVTLTVTIYVCDWVTCVSVWLCVSLIVPVTVCGLVCEHLGKRASVWPTCHTLLRQWLSTGGDFATFPIHPPPTRQETFSNEIFLVVPAQGGRACLATSI